MHILYVDESEVYPQGSSAAQYFILVGISVFERQIYWLSKDLSAIASRFNPLNEAQNIELHGSPMFGGKGFWRKQSEAKRIQAIKDVLRIFKDSHPSNRIFAIVVEKGTVEHPMKYAFKQLVTRFDYYLGRVGYQQKSRQPGLILFDKSVHEEMLQAVTTVYKDEGHQWGQLRYLTEVPAFIDSKSSRLIQLADIVAYAINRKMAHKDEQFYDIIKSKFDTDEGKIHGLHIKTKSSDSN